MSISGEIIFRQEKICQRIKKVIDSCTTQEQLQSCAGWIDNMLTKLVISLDTHHRLDIYIGLRSWDIDPRNKGGHNENS